MIRFSARMRKWGNRIVNITFAAINHVIVWVLVGSIYLERRVVDTVGKAQTGGVNDAQREPSGLPLT